jgi:hypothetical protein
MEVTAGTSAAAGTLGTEVMLSPGTKSDTTNRRTPVTAGKQATVETPATVPATANSTDRSKRGMPTTEHLKQQRHQQQLRQGMPATTGTHKGLKIYYFFL